MQGSFDYPLRRDERAAADCVASKVTALDIAIGHSLHRCVVTLSFARQTAAASEVQYSR
jgi:hypothetical protein